MNSTRSWTAVAVAIAAAAALSGCATHYVGRKLPADGTMASGTKTGIPYTMTKPEFSVDIAPDATDPTKAVYTLKLQDVPDPRHRYTIALDPALLVDGTFEVTLSEQGSLSSATATTSSRVVATLESVVGFVINKAAPGVAAKDMATTLSAYRSVLVSTSEPDCLKPGTKDPKKGVKTELAEFIDLLIAEATIESKDDDADKAKAKASSLAAARFHYLDLAQKACLKAVEPEARIALEKARANVQKAYEGKLAEAKTAASGALADEWIANLEKAVKALDVAAIAKLEKADLPAAVKNVTSQGKTLVNTSIDAKRLAMMGELFAFMTPEVWRARHLQYLERQLNQKRLERLVAGRGSELDREIRLLEEEWAATLGEPKLVQRIAELDAFLAAVRLVPASGGSGPRYAATEHVQLREERDKLQERIDKLRAELLAKNRVVDAEPERKKVNPQTDVRVRLVGPTFVSGVAQHPGMAKDLPEYVLVVSPMDEPTVLPDRFESTPVGGKK